MVSGFLFQVDRFTTDFRYPDVGEARSQEGIIGTWAIVDWGSFLWIFVIYYLDKKSNFLNYYSVGKQKIS